MNLNELMICSNSTTSRLRCQAARPALPFTWSLQQGEMALLTLGKNYSAFWGSPVWESGWLWYFGFVLNFLLHSAVKFQHWTAEDQTVANQEWKLFLVPWTFENLHDVSVTNVINSHSISLWRRFFLTLLCPFHFSRLATPSFVGRQPWHFRHAKFAWIFKAAAFKTFVTKWQYMTSSETYNI